MAEFEPERYELREPPAYQFDPGRREFLFIAGSGLLICLAAGDAEAQTGRGTRLQIADDGVVTVFTGKVEVGQGSRTQIAMAAAEELGIPLEKIRVVMADTSLVPNDGITAGSRTTPSTVPAVRKAAAAARNREVTDARDWRVLGKAQHHVQGHAIVTGAHEFPSDIRRPGMLYGCVLRAPAYGSTLIEADLALAKKLADVVAVREGAFVGCAAPTSFAARKAVEAIAASARWKTEAHPSSRQLFDHLKQTAITEGGRRPRIQTKGSVDQVLSQSGKRVKAAYQVSYIQHAPMEPRAAVAEWDGGSLTVWTGTQNPFGVRDQLAQAFQLGADRVRVIVPDSGGGFGGKHTGEVAIEAARLAKQAAKPVSLRWTRAEEFMWAYFRPAGLFEVEAALDGSLITAWDFTNYNAGAAAIESPYKTAATRTRFVYCNSPLREGSYRGIAATANTFVRECFIDELAQAASADPLEFRLANLENPRLRDVLTAAAKKFRWNERKEKGIGLACGTEKGSYVAACARVEIENGAPKVREFCMAYECGGILNPSNLKAQVEGSIIQGLGGALTEEIQFEGGRLLNGSFAKYRMPRLRDVPPLEIVLLDRRDLPPAGAGETPIIAVAPAIANAVFHATGKRPRSMPVRLG